MTLEKKIRININSTVFFRSFLALIILITLGFSELLAESAEGGNERFKKTSELQNYLIYAAKENPGLKAAFNRWKAELERVTQAKSLPDPVFNYAYFIREVETKVGPQQMKIGLMQKFPWFGKLKLKGEKSLAKARALKENFERVKLDLFYRVKKLYYDYYYLSRSIIIIKENILLIESVNEQIGSMYSTGIASYSNLIRIQVELDKLKDKMSSLKDKLPFLRVALNTVMNRPIEKEIKVENKIEDTGFYNDYKGLIDVMRENNPELKFLDHIAVSEAAGVKLAKKSFFPDVTIGADVIVTGDSQVPGLSDNGKDPFMIRMSLNLPIRFRKLNAAVREAKLRLESVKYDRIEKENRIISSLEYALFTFKDNKRIINLYRDSLIPKALQAFEVTKTSFATGRSGFLDFIDTQRTLLAFELVFEKAKSSYFQNIALIEKIIGKKLIIQK